MLDSISRTKLAISLVLMPMLVSTADASTYLVNFSRTSIADTPWNNWDAFNTPATGTQKTLNAVESGSSQVTLTIGLRDGIVPWHLSTGATTETLFGHSIPATVGESQWTMSDTPGWLTFTLSGLDTSRGYSFQAWMPGNNTTASTTDWTITGASGSSYSSSELTFGSSPVINPTASGTIDLSFYFTANRLAGLSALAFQDAELNTAPEPSAAMLLLVAGGLCFRRRRTA